jgi:nitrous oxidase accessory protein NosD
MKLPLSMLALAALLAIPAQAATLHATPQSLVAMLARANGGDTVSLAPGTYGGLAPKGLAFSPAITLTSEDPAHPATLTNFDIHNCKGLIFRSVELLANPPGYFVFQVFNSSDIHFDRVEVHGAVDGDPQANAEGIRVADSQDFSVTNSEFHDLKRAMAMGTTGGVTVTNNRAHDLGVTGFMFGGGTSHATITDNAVWNIRPKAGDHPDAIQFLTAGATATASDILVARNVVYRGSGEATQGIFLRDQVGSLPFERVTIRENLVVGTGYNGILVMGAKDIAIVGNILISNPGSTNNTWLRVETADGVTARRNRAQLISFDKSSRIVQAGNVETGTVSDGGVAALRTWANAHPDMASTIARMLQTAPPQPRR